MAIVGRRSSDRLFEVYEARDSSVGGKAVLLSTLSKDLHLSEQQLRQVAVESRKAVGLSHPHVAAVLEADIDHGRLYVLSEFLDCETLEQRLGDSGELSHGEALRLATHVCEALSYAHDRGVVHGALNTECIRLLDDGAVKVDDFGTVGALARTETTAGYVRRYRASFVSPEQAKGALPGPPSDVYALGVVLFRLLAGRLPFAGGDPFEVARAHCVAPLPSIRDINGDIPPAVARMVARALAKEPGKRYACAKELLPELRRLAPPEDDHARPSREEIVVAPEREAPEPMTRWAAAKTAFWLVARFALYLLLCVLVAAAAVGLVFVWLFSTPREAVRVPDVVGMEQETAARALGARGLELVVAGEAYSADVRAGRIARVVSPYPGKQVREGRKVRVVISKGAPGVRVPVVTGLSEKDARAALEKVGLKVVVRRQHSSIVPSGKVVRQSPPASSRVMVGAPVSVYVSDGPPRGVALNPDRPVKFRITVIVPGGARSHRVRIEAVDAGGRRHAIHDELHAPGQRIEEVVSGRGWALLRVYVDQELVREVKPAGE